MDFSLEPTVAGAALAAAAVAGGGPLFTGGLRAVRLRYTMARLRERPLAESPTGFVHTSGRVALDSPLFSPLTNRPCAGFRLEVSGAGTRAGGTVEERRSFRIVSGGVRARVIAEGGRWELSPTSRREVRAGEPLSEHLDTLLRRCAEAGWLRGQGRSLTLTEHALLAGAECHVIGQSRASRPYELPVEGELVRTGTDGAVRIGATPIPRVKAQAARRRPFGRERRRAGRPFPDEVDLWVDAGGALEYVRVSDRPPTRTELAVSPWPGLGLVLGPALSLGGLLYLARAADVLRDHGRF
ncbi:MAG: hypothetical protein E6K81_07775 [Candidatus Eisenbacteria bacterium]|uniref:Uncharacterized protein n=1 Tax=Eiseniibacteriota bacterium TaxID=2212470 RepID=A0A538U8R5_UNCEI|nr:MAG: hypothetical protein E6K81_07775 [Candidatus Eisenbacteria bacterium]